jgi:hypothetical protein
MKLTFSPLYYGKTRKITFTYDLPAGGPRSFKERRVGYVYSKFCASGPGTDTGRLRVVVPAGYAMRVDETIGSTNANGKTTFDSGNMKKNPWEFYPCFQGENANGYASIPVVTSDGHSVTIEPWKEDVTWAEATRASVTEDLPALVTLFGEFPAGKDLTIREYLTGQTHVEGRGSKVHYLSEALATREAVTDDLVEIWLPRDAFSADWMVEGYAAWAQREAGLATPPCDKPQVGEPVRRDLDLWVRLGSAPIQPDKDTIAYQRQAACYLISQVAKAIGTDRVVETLGAIRDSTDPWRSDQNAPQASSFSWRSWMDMMTERGYVPAGVDPSPLAELLIEYGIADDPAVLTARAQTHAAYHELAALMRERQPPKAVTSALARWDFDAAGAAIAKATAAWEDTATVESKLTAIDVDGGDIRLAVANASSQADLDAAAEKAATQAALATNLAEALAKQDSASDPLQSIGLLGVAPPDTATIVDAVARVDSDAATSGTAAINASLDSARDVGVQRLAVGLIALVVVVLAAWFVSRRVRASRRAGADAGGAGPAEP